MEDLPIQGPVFLIETGKITPNPQQPRRDFDENSLQELAASIREFGVLQPIVVSKIEYETETGTEVAYQLIAGERRWRASQLAGLERIPAIIKNVKLERERLELAVIENVQRADLNPIETARAYAKLQDEFGLTQREIASRLGKSREAVANTVRLLNLSSVVQDAIARNQISESQARLLLTVPEIDIQQNLFQDLLRENLSVRELKSRIQKVKERTAELRMKETAPIADPETEMIQKQLEQALGTPVKVERAGATGRITIAFYSPEELQNIVYKLATAQPVPSEQYPKQETPPMEGFTY